MVAPSMPVSDKEHEPRLLGSSATTAGACLAPNTPDCARCTEAVEAGIHPSSSFTSCLENRHVQGPDVTKNVHNHEAYSSKHGHNTDPGAEHAGTCTHVDKSVRVHTPSLSSSDDTVHSTSTATMVALEDLRTGVMSLCGLRAEMEDAVTVVHRFLHVSCKEFGVCPGSCASCNGQEDINLPLHFFGVYDGHGGSQVSSFCRERLHIALIKEIQSPTKAHESASSNAWEINWEQVMRAAFLKIDAEVEGCVWRNGGGVKERITEPIAPDTVGSTAIVAVVGSCEIIVANCGDSRAVLSRGDRAIALSADHKPNREDEMERIEAAGGRVICWNGYRVFGVLAMSRAIGDRYLKPYVIAEPEVKCIARSEDDECLILASDGLWDVLTNEEACEVARKCLRRRSAIADGSVSPGFTTGSNDENAEAAAALLTKIALAQGSHDNISVVVVDLKGRI